MKRVAVTGLGVICPLGDGVESTWNAMREGRSGIERLQRMDPSSYRVKIGGEIKDRQRIEGFEKEQGERYERSAVLSILAVQEALENSGLSTQELDRLRLGTFFGTTMGGVQLVERLSELNAQKRTAEINPDCFDKVQGSHIAFAVLDYLGLCGETMVFSNACASGNYAIGWGFDQIRGGKLDAALCGGVDAFSRVAFTGFNRLLSLTPDKCRPFSANRKGLVVSEGVGVLLLEELGSARARGAHIYCEIGGYGLGMDAYHMTSPHPEGSGAFESIQRAMEQAHLEPKTVDFISAHGTGTPANDKTESIAIKKFFGTDCKIPVDSIKSMIGHTMGAASAIEAVMTCLSLDRGVLLPTINWEIPDENCVADCVPNQSRSFSGKIALSNSFAFGGNTSCLVMMKEGKT
ncbi:MAG TPA: beta-ketoacyl-[acyl-carrier-protein] synthase family protein [bacterium]|nr:beta-ketoacyl-[acyl-carrier-protein] synthase family protein [bacterium]